jgi:hypothetical protein
LRVEGLGYKAEGLELRVLRVWDLELRVLRVWGLPPRLTKAPSPSAGLGFRGFGVSS